MPSNHQQLLQLTYIRFVILCGQCGALALALFYLQLPLNFWSLGSALALLGLLNFFTYARLHSAWPVTEPELFSQLLADTIIYGFILYHAGGGTNPFIFMLLIPLIITVMTLQRRYIWMMAISVIAIYGSLLIDYVPIVPATEHRQVLQTFARAHMFAMWLNFSLTVIVITYFIANINRTLQQQQLRLQTTREAQVNNLQLLSLASVAAGTAHELGTPLNTMRVVLEELQLDPDLNAQQQEDLALLQQQVDACAAALKQMVNAVTQEQDSEQTMLATTFLEQVLAHWSLMRPSARWQLTVQDDLPPDLRSSTALRQALINLLNNAADACTSPVDLSLHWDQDNIWLTIRDDGAGISATHANDIGKAFVTHKGGGLGIGLFLTATTLARQDGEVRLYPAESGGTIAEVRLSRRAVHG